MDSLGQPTLRQENMLQSLRLTPMEDHAFLTKVQAYIFCLADEGFYDAANTYLLNLYRKAPEQYLPEIQEMMEAIKRQALEHVK